MDANLSKLQEIVKDGEAWFAACNPWGHSQAQLSYWSTTAMWVKYWLGDVSYWLIIFLLSKVHKQDTILWRSEKNIIWFI